MRTDTYTFRHESLMAVMASGRMRQWLSLFVILSFGVANACAQTEDYPARPIRVVVAYAPGGATDVLARMLGEKLTQSLGRQLVIDNRPGASGMIGAQTVARAAPDGYTLLVAGANEAALNVALFKSMPYDPRTDLAPITLLAVAPVILVSGPKASLKTLKDVLAAARKSSINFGSVGIGTPNHIAGELFNSMAGTRLNHIPYPGAGPAMIAVLGDQVPLAFLSLASAAPHVKSGALQPIAITTPKRFPSFPDIPTIAELGFADFNVGQWYGVLATGKTPPSILNRLHAEFTKALKDPQIRNRMLELGADPVGDTPAQFAAFVRTEIEKYRGLAVKAGIEPQ